MLVEMDEFATNVLGDPWDMNEPSDLTRYRSDSGLINSTFNNGIYSAQMTAGDGGEKITLLKAGAPNHTALRIGINLSRSSLVATLFTFGAVDIAPRSRNSAPSATICLALLTASSSFPTTESL